MRADPAERSPETSPSDRADRILALEELHAMGILGSAEFITEMKCITDPESAFDRVSPEHPAHQRWRQQARVLTRRFSLSPNLALGGRVRRFGFVERDPGGS